MSKGPSCWRCGRTGVEIAWSDQLCADVCRNCLPEVSPAPPPLPRAKQPPRPKPSAYARLHQRVWAALETVGEVFPACDGTGRMAGYCPVCTVGVVELRLINTDPPRVRTDGCTDGCSAELLAKAL